ncbi:MAG: ABC transporter permease [Solirubrobacterales bacterium]|nr:ABC transporter permease [Solirubrobacterales bacterium]MBV9715568.1 ABC transporter permease [Solirubrobacterales bacterium]
MSVAAELRAPDRARPPPSAGAVRAVYRVERRKLSAQPAIRLLALICVLAPFLFAAILKIQTGSPTDTLYGVWVHASGFALSLVVLSFAGSWGVPVVVGIVAGDLFSSEDRYGTWKLVLTRACSRRDLFLGKLLAAGTFSLTLIALTAVASLAAGIVLVGHQPLVSLSGTMMSSGRSLLLVLLAWLLTVPPALALAALAVVLSVATRNGIVGVFGPGLAALAMQLLLLVGAGVWAHLLLLGFAFTTWPALFTAHPFYGPLIAGVLVSVAWAAAAVAAAWAIVRRRDFAGAPVARRRGWRPAGRVALALTAVIVLFALAGGWGPAGVTADRLKGSLIPAFNNLTVLQQLALGRPVAPGARLNIVLPTCSRRGSAPRGPGDWVCTVNVIIPAQGSLPPQPTAVTYDVSVQSNGCYKAQSPPAFIGQQTMRDAAGHSVINPLYTIYGCFNVL